MLPKEYLGDSVYAEFDGYAIILTTDNGLGASNTIVLDSAVFSELLRYVEVIRAAHKDKES